MKTHEAKLKATVVQPIQDHAQETPASMMTPETLEALDGLNNRLWDLIQKARQIHTFAKAAESHPAFVYSHPGVNQEELWDYLNFFRDASAWMKDEGGKLSDDLDSLARQARFHR